MLQQVLLSQEKPRWNGSKMQRGIACPDWKTFVTRTFDRLSARQAPIIMLCLGPSWSRSLSRSRSRSLCDLQFLIFTICTCSNQLSNENKLLLSCTSTLLASILDAKLWNPAAVLNWLRSLRYSPLPLQQFVTSWSLSLSLSLSLSHTHTHTHKREGNRDRNWKGGKKTKKRRRPQLVVKNHVETRRDEKRRKEGACEEENQQHQHQKKKTRDREKKRSYRWW